MVERTDDRIVELNNEFRELTGRDAYLYTSRPGDGQTRVVFTDGVKFGYRQGLDHMRELLVRVTEGYPGS